MCLKFYCFQQIYSEAVNRGMNNNNCQKLALQLKFCRKMNINVFPQDVDVQSFVVVLLLYLLVLRCIYKDYIYLLCFSCDFQKLNK